MAVLQEFSREMAVDELHYFLFLYCNEYIEHNHYYQFIPQKTGPYSIQADADKSSLISKKCLDNSDDWLAKENIERFAIPLDFFEKIAIQKMKNTWEGRTNEELALYLQEKYPSFFLIDKSASVDDIKFFTIGYEGVSPDEYIKKLLDNNVALLCDVRKNAYSQKYGFTKHELKMVLEKVGIKYLHIPELGIESEKRQSLETYSDYKTLFDFYEHEILPKQQPSISRLVNLLKENKRIAITCFEAKHHECHRSRVAEALEKRDDFNYEVINL